MSIRVALHHQTRYRYDRLVALSPQEVRLRPAPHCRTPVLSYSLTVEPERHFINWQQDAFGNYIARFVFPEKTRELDITVDLVADMTVINPFDFFIDSSAEKFPFSYDDRQRGNLAPFLAVEEPGPLFARWLADFRAAHSGAINTVDYLVAINRRLQQDIRYLVRMEPGVQGCEQTLALGSGSCRDSGWLLVQLLRHCGLAARFVSGYLIQLAADLKPLDGPAGPERDFTDLHAWAEAYIPGAGWIGLDPTSGLLAGEGHLPLACTAAPADAAPITGHTEPCQSQFDFAMQITRVHEDPRVTRPYSGEQWQSIDALGRQVDAELKASDVRLTQGGEPTFISADDMDGEEWNFTALSPAKRALAENLQRRLQARFAPGGMLHFGQGKWYPGEAAPRWALGIHWRKDGKPIWNDAALFAAGEDSGHGTTEAKRLIEAIAGRLGLSAQFIIPAFEDAWQALDQESRLPPNIDPLNADLDNDVEHARLAAQLRQGLNQPAGFVLPLRAATANDKSGARWESSRWPLRRRHLFLLASSLSIGYRLPLDSLPATEERDDDLPRDPFEPVEALDDADIALAAARTRRKPKADPKPREVVRTALCVQARDGCLYVFLPPLPLLEDYLALVATVETAAADLRLPLHLEGYEPPLDARISTLKITPDPGVIEVNIHPAADWDGLASNITALYEETRAARLSAEKFMLDGRHTGTGGGNHVTLGGATPADSPLLRRPDLLKSMITYWQNHPALSYLFAGLFIGPTSQAPRIDEARDDNLYELEIAFQQLMQQHLTGEESPKPWLVDRLLRNLLVDLTGNTHRTEFCIDKLYSPEGSYGRLGLLEFRAFEMPPHPRMSLVQMLLLRALTARFWKTPYAGRLVRWGTQLHDRFMLPHFVVADMQDVVRDLQAAGYAFDFAWFAPFIEFRFPRFGTVVYDNIRIELRQAIEPWHVLGEEVASGATARYVDSSVERVQVKVSGMTGARHVVTCNHRALPLCATGVPGEFVAGVRYRAWHPPSALHPTIGVHTPLVFDIVDTWSNRSIGGCTYHVAHPGGRNYETLPVNANEAEARRLARFWDHGHTPGPMAVAPEPVNPDFPLTLDLRWSA
ncbi:MAG TPA: transglutaminase family protein [Burkholderiales bacterium]|nr:transglutaminase family protein [Burkholderiales bacterium]